MSKNTTVKRKFLEEQVKKVLNELGGRDPTGWKGKLIKTPAQAADLKAFFKGVGKEILDIPVLLHKKLERHIEFDGDFHRQSLKRADIDSQMVKEFFSLFVPTKATTTSITRFRYDYEQVLDEDFNNLL